MEPQAGCCGPRPGEEIVAMLDHGKFDWAERVPEGTPFAEEQTLFDASELGRASLNTR